MHGGRPKGVTSGGQFYDYICNAMESFAPFLGEKAGANEYVAQMCAFVT